jgi:ketosteroid isomerase-like protein
MGRRLKLAMTAAAALLAALSGCSAPGARDTGAAAVGPDMVQAELAFARAAAQGETRAAFLQYLAQDSVVFAPAPVNGRDYWRRQPADPGGLLVWYPSLAQVAASGDLGFDFGPFSYGPRGAEPTEFGHFLTLWRRAPDGSWQVLIDGGTGHARPSVVATALDTAPRAASAARARAPLQRAEAQLAASSERAGYDEAVRQLLLPQGWRLRATHEPLSIDAPPLPQAERRGPARLVVAGSGTSRARDLGYAYGELTDAADGRRYAFLHVWQASRGQWRLVVDRLSRIP